MIPEEELNALKQRWLNSSSFKDEQAYLAARVRMGDVRFVYLDPDGTLPDWVVIIVRHETGVVYGIQCAGVATEQRFIEGYLVPAGGSKYDIDEGTIGVGPFVEVFHESGACQWSWTGQSLPPERQAFLGKLVESIPFWGCALDRDDHKHRIQIDKARIDEVAEGWIPIQTPDGPGVLLFKNCD